MADTPKPRRRHRKATVRKRLERKARAEVRAQRARAPVPADDDARQLPVEPPKRSPYKRDPRFKSRAVKTDVPKSADGSSGRDARGRFTSNHPNAWRPGRSGNPHGRPKRRTFTELFYAELERKAPPELLEPMREAFGGELPSELRNVAQIELMASLLVQILLESVIAKKPNLELFREIAGRLDPMRRRVEIDQTVQVSRKAREIADGMTSAEAADAYHAMLEGGDPDGDTVH